VVERGKELPCSECQGRGEFPVLDGCALQSPESRERWEALYRVTLGR
jgi:hypothetical protein